MIVVMVIAISALAVKANAFTLGQIGSDVADLQISLIEAGFDIPAITSGAAQPGYFGVQTQAALAARDGSQPKVKFGAVAGPDLFSDYFNVNGVSSWYYSKNLNSTGSTTCSFRTPAATTTLVAATARLDRIASTTVFEIGYSAVSGFATTSLIATKTITTATQDVVLASTTSNSLANLTPANAIPPRTFINFKIGGGSVAGTLTPLGVCKLVLREV